MQREEKTEYLANLYHLIMSDGKVTESEERFIDSIAWEIESGYLLKRKARDMAGEKDFKLKMLDRWSDLFYKFHFYGNHYGDFLA